MKPFYKISVLTLLIFISVYSAFAAEIDLLGLALDVKESGLDVDNVNIIPSTDFIKNTAKMRTKTTVTVTTPYARLLKD